MRIPSSFQQLRCPQCDVPVYSGVKHADTCTWEAERARLTGNASVEAVARMNVGATNAYCHASDSYNEAKEVAPESILRNLDNDIHNGSVWSRIRKACRKP